MRLKIILLIVALAALLIGQAVMAQSAQDTIELIGTIDAVNADGSIVVNGVTITITTAELHVALTVGQVVKVEGTLLSDGRIAAREVQAPDDNDVQDDDEIELVGVVESFDGTTLVVNGITIDVSGAEINSPIVVGQIVKVHASFDANGNLIARETDNNVDDDNDDDSPSPESTPEVDDVNDDDGDDDRPGEFEIVGTLEQVGDGFIVVNGQTISITSAEIKNQLVVGSLVKLHLSNQDGQLVAREVENARTRSGDDDNSGSGSHDDRWDEVYTVRPGDTLSSIAARAGVTVEELARINNITDTSVVVTGTHLIVPHSFDDDDNGGSSGSGSSDDSGDDDDNSGPGSGSDDDGSDDDSSHDSDDDNGSNSGSGSDSDDDDGGGDDDNGGNSGSGGGGDDSDDD